MNSLFDFENDTDQFLNLVIILILVMVAIAFVLLGMTATERFIKIYRNKKKALYQTVADQLLFEMLFENQPLEKSLDRYQAEKFRGTLFKKIMIKSIVSLHRNYSGIYQEKLEVFYAQSDLVDYSLKKLASHRWYDVAEGIRDLAMLNFKPAHKHIRRLLEHHHELVQKEAFTGLVKLQGLEALIHHKHTDLYLDDWTQSTILYLVKAGHINPHPELATVLEGTNDSLSLLAARLFDYYKDNAHAELIQQFQNRVQSPAIRQELQQITSRLTSSSLL